MRRLSLIVSSFLACGGCLSTVATEKDAGAGGVITAVVADVSAAALVAAAEPDHTSDGHDLTYGERFMMSLGGVLVLDLAAGVAAHTHPN